jgi:hypothetical protein
MRRGGAELVAAGYIPLDLVAARLEHGRRQPNGDLGPPAPATGIAPRG